MKNITGIGCIIYAFIWGFFGYVGDLAITGILGLGWGPEVADKWEATNTLVRVLVGLFTFEFSIPIWIITYIVSLVTGTPIFN